MTLEKNVAVAANRVLVDGDVFRVVSNAFACSFKEPRLSTTGGSDVEHKKHVGQISTIMRALTNKDGDLLSDFDEIDESETEVENKSLHHHLFNNHNVAAIKSKNKGQLSLEYIFGFCRTFEKFFRQLGFHLTFRTADLQDIIYTSVGDKIKIFLLNYFCMYQYSFPMLNYR